MSDDKRISVAPPFVYKRDPGWIAAMKRMPGVAAARSEMAGHFRAIRRDSPELARRIKKAYDEARIAATKAAFTNWGRS